MVTSILAGCMAFLYSLFIRLELSVIGVGVLFGDYQMYNVLVTSHGLLMLLAFVIPITTGGFANYFLPTLLGVPDMLFASMNNMSYWLYTLGFLFLLCGIFVEEGIGLGWTLYPTLLCTDFHSSLAVDFGMFSVHSLGISTIMNSINIIGTIIACSRSYYSMTKLSLFIWGILLTSVLLILVLPVLAGAVTMVLLDRNVNTCFYDVLGGGDLVLFQHLFWFFGHPEVYIIILPVFGLISMLFEINTNKSVFSSVGMIYSMLSISILGFLVWSHHMFTVGLDVDTSSYFGSLTMLIGVPTAIKLFNWIYSICSSDAIIFVEVLFMYLFILTFLLGGITGLFLANAGIDILMHDTYFVVAHFHYVLSLGATVGILSGLVHFMPSWSFTEYSFLYVYVGFFVLFLGSNLMFMPLHVTGLFSFPSSISDYPVCYLGYSYLSEGGGEEGTSGSSGKGKKGEEEAGG